MSPRRRDGELGPALNTDRLLDDLLGAAERGSLPLASDAEWRAWERAWGETWRAKRRARGLSDYTTDAHGRCWVYAPEPPLEDMPVAVARRHAIILIEVVAPMMPAVKRSQAEDLARKAWCRAHPSPPADAESHGRLNAAQWAHQNELAAYMAENETAFVAIEEQRRAECAAACEDLIRRFRLGDLARVAPVPTPDDPTAPSPAARAEPGAQEIP